MVYACRYGHQPLSEVESWSFAKMHWFLDHLGKIVEAENPEPDDQE